MSLKDLLSLTDAKLRDAYHAVKYEASKDRAKLAKRIDDTLAKYNATEQPRGQKDYRIRNNVVEYSPTLGGKPVRIGDTETHYVPGERFGDFLTKLKALVTGGSLDKELEAASVADKAPKRTPRAVSASGGSRGGWSDERKAKFAATIAARNAKK